MVLTKLVYAQSSKVKIETLLERYVSPKLVTSPHLERVDSVIVKLFTYVIDFMVVIECCCLSFYDKYRIDHK